MTEYVINIYIQKNNLDKCNYFNIETLKITQKIIMQQNYTIEF